MRAFHTRLGLDRSADRLPPKFFKPLVGAGPTADVALSHEEIEAAKDEYYHLAGWDVATGDPTLETMARLGLGEY